MTNDQFRNPEDPITSQMIDGMDLNVKALAEHPPATLPYIRRPLDRELHRKDQI